LIKLAILPKARANITGARYNAQAADIDCMIATCGDRMEKFAELGVKPKIVVAYEIDGKKHEEWQPEFHDRKVLVRVKPVFAEFDPWKQFMIDGDLSKEADIYIRSIEDLMGIKFSGFSYGQVEKISRYIMKQ